LDHYLSLFFIPIIPIKRGERFIECNRCGGIFSEIGRPEPRPSFQFQNEKICPRCGEEISQEFKFCPYCGQKI